MGCAASKTDPNGEGMASHYKYNKPPIPRRESEKNLGRKTTSVSSSSPRTPKRSGRVVHGQDREIQGKRGNDDVTLKGWNRSHGSGKLGFVEMKEGRYPSLGEAPSFKDYLVSSNNDGVDEVTKMNNGSDDEDFLAYASAGEASPMPIGEESENKDDAIVGEACLLPPRDSRERKSKVKGRRWVMTRDKLKNILHASSWITHNHKPSIGRASTHRSSS